MCHDAAGADHCAVSDVHAGKNAYATADPDIVSDGDTGGRFQACIARFNVQRMRRGVETDVRADENMISDGDPSSVKHGQIVVTVKVIAYERVITIVKIDGWFKIGIASQMTEELSQKAVAARRTDAVIDAGAQTLGALTGAKQLRICRSVKLSCCGFFFFCHSFKEASDGTSRQKCRYKHRSRGIRECADSG